MRFYLEFSEGDRRDLVGILLEGSEEEPLFTTVSFSLSLGSQSVTPLLRSAQSEAFGVVAT